MTQQLFEMTTTWPFPVRW